MPRFGVNFGKRKTAANSDDSQNGPVGESSFRVLDRSEVAPAKGPVDGGLRASQPSVMPVPGPPKASLSINPYGDDNMFADLKYNRSSGASNATKTTASTDNSSRHSNASTTPSSADIPPHEDPRIGNKMPFSDIPVPPVPKSSSGWSLKNAGRTFSFGAQKRQLPTVPSEPAESEKDFSGRARSKTASTDTTSTTATPPTLNDQDFSLDLGGDFSNMFRGSGFDKRASVMTLRQQQMQQQQQQQQMQQEQERPDDRPALAPRSLTGNRLNQPSPIRIDRTTRVEESPYSWNSLHSGDQLISASPIDETAPPPVPKHGVVARVPRTNTDTSLKRSSAVFGRRRSTEPSDGDDEDAKLLKQSIAVAKFLDNPPPVPSSGTSSGRYRRNEGVDLKDEDDNMFDSARVTRRFVGRQPGPPQNKVMTPAEFEKYRKDKERQDTSADATKEKSDDEEEVNYEDDEDEVEKAKQLSKQRRKQEANMAVYRQQMMKVTGESNPGAPGHSVSASLSTPNLTLSVTPPVDPGRSEGSDPDDDEEVPLAILAAHGFPNKNRPPNRLSHMMSNPSLRSTVMGPNIQRPESAMDGSAVGGRLPAFARRLPQDPYGLVNNAVREPIHMGGGAPSPGHPSAVPPGGLVGVIANEERSRAMRRGSPSIDVHGSMGQPGLGNGGNGGFDPMAGIPANMMYPQQPMFTPGEQAQMQMNQQMQQFMQMQMQFMQMMATGQNPGGTAGMRPGGHTPTQSMGEISRKSFLDPGYDSVRGDAALRTMSMVQPSSASFYGQPMGGMSKGAPSIHIQGQYAPSIAPSERSNIGLPGRYRPVSHVPPPASTSHLRSVSTMSGALGGATLAPPKQASKPASDDDDDEEQGWEAMKAKRDKKKSMWRSKKTFGAELGALIH